MTNIQLLLTIGIPSMLVILSWLHSNTRVSRLEKTVDDGFNRVDQRLVVIESDLRTFYSVTGTLQGRLDEMSRSK